MKGRTISATHRARISASLTGKKNPRFGRKLSQETKARIGAAVAAAANARKQKTHQPEPRRKSIADLTPEEKFLRLKALNSPLFKPVETERKPFDRRNNEEVDKLLQNVREGYVPPDRVKKLISHSEAVRISKR